MFPCLQHKLPPNYNLFMHFPIPDNILLQEGYCKLALENKQQLDSFLIAQPLKHSCSTFSTLFIWDILDSTWWKIENNWLILFSNQTDPYLPLIPRTVESTQHISSICKKIASSFDLSIIKIEFLDEFEYAMFSNFTVHETYYDYVYNTQHIIDLKGNNYASRRSTRNAFLRNNCNIQCLPYDMSHFNACVALLNKWQNQSFAQDDVLSHKKRFSDQQCTLRALKYYQALELIGMTLYVGDQLIGFTFGEMLDEKTCNIIIEKTDRNFKGSAEFIWSEFLKQYWKHTTFCNAGDDWGIPSLAWTKKSYHPCCMVRKWRASYAV